MGTAPYPGTGPHMQQREPREYWATRASIIVVLSGDLLIFNRQPYSLGHNEIFSVNSASLQTYMLNPEVKVSVCVYFIILLHSYKEFPVLVECDSGNHQQHVYFACALSLRDL